VPTIKESPPLIAAVGFALLGLIYFGAAPLLRHAGASCLNIWSLFFTLTTWSALVDLVLGLALLGYTNLGAFYMESGEEYFKSSWGVSCLLYDGLVHFVLQVILACRSLRGKPCGAYGLFWAGSIINSMPVLLLGAATGHFSGGIKPSTALNAPYIAVPIAFLAIQMSQQASGSSASQRAPQGKCSWAPKDVIIITGHVVVILLHIWRAMVVLGCQLPAAGGWVHHVEAHLAMDPVTRSSSFGFIRVQALQFFFYFVPWHAWAASCQLRSVGVDRTVAACSMVVFGAYAQAQVTWICTGVMRWDSPVDFELLAAPSMCGLNIALLIHAALTAISYYEDCPPLRNQKQA